MDWSDERDGSLRDFRREDRVWCAVLENRKMEGGGKSPGLPDSIKGILRMAVTHFKQESSLCVSL